MPGRFIGFRTLAWAGYALLLVAAPLVFSSGAALSILSQMGCVIIFALSFNMLLGQGGMLTLGHAVYSGLGAYVAIHAMNLASTGMPLPVSLVPLVGGLGGMLFGALFGYVTTRKSGTTFAMITLGIVELVHASVLMFPGFFGGEGGITGNRVIGEPVLGITFGPQIQVYYLIAVWLFICTAAMYALTATPFGRLLNAVRDNPERVEFIGFDARWVRYLALILSGFFAGVSGGLTAINFEIVTAENVSVLRSAAVLLSTFIGGIGHFFGPIIGGVIGVFMTGVLSSYTEAWQLYLGALFVLMVVVAPGGIAGMLDHLWKLIRQSGVRVAASRVGLVAAPALLAFAGFVLLAEMSYRRLLEDGGPLSWWGIVIDTHSLWPWGVGVLLLAAGMVLMRVVSPSAARRGAKGQS